MVVKRHRYRPSATLDSSDDSCKVRHMADTKLWTVAEIAKAAHTSAPTITDALRKKRLRGAIKGRTWIVRDDDAREYIRVRLALVKATDAARAS